MIRLPFYALAVILLAWVLGCTSDTLIPDVSSEICNNLNATYDSNMKLVIDANCAFSGCHVSGFPSGDFSTYAGMLPRLENGRIKQEVLDAQTMPQGFALSDEHFELFQCWIQDGYPEN